MEYTKELHEYWDEVFTMVNDKTKLNGVDAGFVRPLLDEITRLQSLTQWVPVTERLPVDSMPVLIRIHGYVYPKIAQHTELIKQWASTDGMYWHDISYSLVESWMPLPGGVK
jgi:hypothetical protein